MWRNVKDNIECHSYENMGLCLYIQLYLNPIFKNFCLFILLVLISSSSSSVSCWIFLSRILLPSVRVSSVSSRLWRQFAAYPRFFRVLLRIFTSLCRFLSIFLFFRRLFRTFVSIVIRLSSSNPISSIMLFGDCNQQEQCCIPVAKCFLSTSSLIWPSYTIRATIFEKVFWPENFPKTEYFNNKRIISLSSRTCKLSSRTCKLYYPPWMHFNHYVEGLCILTSFWLRTHCVFPPAIGCTSECNPITSWNCI